MTAIGKMLVFLVLFLSLVWNFLVVNAYTARTNWQREAKKYQADAVAAADAANKMKALRDAEAESSDDAKRALQQERDRYYTQVAQLLNVRDALGQQYKPRLLAGPEGRRDRRPAPGDDRQAFPGRSTNSTRRSRPATTSSPSSSSTPTTPAPRRSGPRSRRSASRPPPSATLRPPRSSRSNSPRPSSGPAASPASARRPPPSASAAPSRGSRRTATATSSSRSAPASTPASRRTRSCRSTAPPPPASSSAS